MDPVDGSCCDVATLDVSAVLVVVVIVSGDAEFRSGASDSEAPAPTLVLVSVTMPYTTGCGVQVGSAEGSADVEGSVDIEGEEVSLSRCLLPIIESKAYPYSPCSAVVW